jgi:propionate CoA-transferase
MKLRPLEQARTVAQMARAAVSWLRQDTRHPIPVPENPRFMTAYDAARLVRDGDVIGVSGVGAQARASIIYRALRERFDETGHPARLTVLNVGGHGGRGVLPGTLEELGCRGFCTRLITSHFEALKAMLELAAAGDCELQCIPLGVMTRLFEALGRGEDAWVCGTGVGTFLDPRVGAGSRLGSGGEQLISADGDRLRYRIPPVDVAIFNLPAADRRGNLYARGCATVGESRELARAAKRHRGRVIANVGLVVEPGYGEVFLPSEQVDAVVYHPDTEQTAGVFHREPWAVLTEASDLTIEEGLARVRLVNRLSGAARRRTAADEVLARLAALTLLEHVPRGARISIGTGLPEEVARAVFEGGRLPDLTFLVESGTVGGLPAPGAYFGAALCPERILPSVEVFKLCDERLDATCLGALQVDGDGNVNVSRRGGDVRAYVGPGGFPDFTAAAQTIVFVCSWMHGGEIRVAGGEMHLARRGDPKFVERLDEVTFNGPLALRQGKRVLWVTHAGVFRLTPRGVELAQAMPGLDVRRDIVGLAGARIVVPASGRVPRVPRSIVSGEGFTLPGPAPA